MVTVKGGGRPKGARKRKNIEDDDVEEGSRALKRSAKGVMGGTGGGDEAVGVGEGSVDESLFAKN